MIYQAIDNQIFANHELFLTVHPTDATLTPAQQAALIAQILNEID